MRPDTDVHDNVDHVPSSVGRPAHRARRREVSSVARPVTEQDVTTPSQSTRSLATLGRGAWSLLAVSAVAAGGVWVAVRFLEVIVPVVVAALITSLVWPASRWLQEHGVPRLAATWAILLGMLAAVGGALWWIIPTISNRAANLQSSVGGGLTRVEDWLVTGPFGFSRSRIDGWSTDLRGQFSSFESTAARGLLTKAPLIIHLVGGIVLTIVLVFFFLHEGKNWHRRLPSIVGDTTEARLLNVWDSLTGFSRGLVINAFVNAVVLGVALAILGVPLAGPIAAVTFVASFVPIIGAIVSGAVAALVALVAVGPGAAFVVVIVTVLIHHLEGYVVGPRVIGKRTGLHPVVLILALVIGIRVAGVAGGFLAGPIAAAASGWFRPMEADACVDS